MAYIPENAPVRAGVLICQQVARGKTVGAPFLLAQAVLTVAGYHQHDRGAWRKRRW
jgi:hypothetical protein